MAAFVVALAAAATLVSSIFPRKEEQLEVLFPLMFIKRDPLLLDPANLDTIYEYYLLENLAIGLIRDDASQQGGYRPLLAKDWNQTDDRTWEFELRQDLTWSDGNPILGRQVAEYFHSFRGRKSRHLVYLPDLDHATFDDATAKLTLFFAHHVNEGLLHELTLADSSLLHPTNRTQGWKITSGPYSVESYAPDDSTMLLRLNPSSPLARATSPRSVHLFWPTNRELLKGAFKDLKVDLYYELLHSFRNTTRIIRANAPQAYQGHASTLYYFKFNPAHPLIGDVVARREFTSLVQEAFRDVSLSASIRYDNQFIPAAYAGRLPEVPDRPVSITKLRGLSLRVILPAAFKEADTAVTKLVDTAKKNGVQLAMTLSDDDSASDADVPLAVFHSFKGNQRDALGSWSFLYSEGFGSLSHFRPEVEDVFSAIARSDSSKERSELLVTLHKRTIENAYAVPFLSEANCILASERVALDNINPFDLRLRFYDVTWK